MRHFKTSERSKVLPPRRVQTDLRPSKDLKSIFALNIKASENFKGAVS